MKMWPDKLKQLHPHAFRVNKLPKKKKKGSRPVLKDLDVNCLLSGVRGHEIVLR